MVDFSSQNLATSLLSLLGVFLAGLALNLTPCVYPMLSVTVSLFSGRQTMTRGQSFLRALLYVLGISTMYSALGLAAALTGGFFGAVLQNPLVLTVIALFLFALSLSMFGVYTFQLPNFVRNSAQTVKMTNLLGIYGSGILVGVFAAPCIGPPVLALLTYVGSIGNPGYGFFLFFVLSLGLGLPYLLLGAFSGLFRNIPKSGSWMVWVERLFGVVLVSFAAFYLILAWKPHLLGLLVPVSLFAGGVYLGFLEKSEKYPPAFLPIKRIFGASAVLAALFIYFSSVPREAVQWEPYSESSVAQAAAQKRPAVLDFYADWCIPCHELDRFTYSDPDVIEALKGFRRFKVDLTRADSPQSIQTAEKFDVLGIPAVVFLDESGSEVREARVSGFVPPAEFLESVSKVVRNRGEPKGGEPWQALIGTPAQEWSASDWTHSKPLTLEGLKGKVVLVRFWTGPHCPYCRASAAALNEFYEKYHGQGLEIVGLYHHKSEEPLRERDVEKLADGFGFRFPVAIDRDWQTLRTWWLDRVETDWTSVSFLIDRKGNIRFIHPGGQYVKGDNDYGAIESRIKELLSK